MRSTCFRLVLTLLLTTSLAACKKKGSDKCPGQAQPSFEADEKGFTCKSEDGKRFGPSERYWENGQIKERGSYGADGKQDGKLEQWHENGQLAHEASYKAGDVTSDTLKRWDENGKITASLLFKDGKQHGLQYSTNDRRVSSYSLYHEGTLIGAHKVPVIVKQEWSASLPDGVADSHLRVIGDWVGFTADDNAWFWNAKSGKPLSIPDNIKIGRFGEVRALGQSLCFLDNAHTSTLSCVTPGKASTVIDLGFRVDAFAYSDKSVFVAGHDPEQRPPESTIAARLDPSSKSPIWKKTISTTDRVLGSALTSEAFVVHDRDTVRFFRRAAGDHEKWELGSDPDSLGWSAADPSGALVVVSHASGLKAFKNAAAALWDEAIAGELATVVGDTLLIRDEANRVLSAHDMKDGAKKWSSQVNGDGCRKGSDDLVMCYFDDEEVTVSLTDGKKMSQVRVPLTRHRGEFVELGSFYESNIETETAAVGLRYRLVDQEMLRIPVDRELFQRYGEAALLLPTKQRPTMLVFKRLDNLYALSARPEFELGAKTNTLTAAAFAPTHRLEEPVPATDGWEDLGEIPRDDLKMELNDGSDLQKRLDNAREGDTIEIEAGRHEVKFLVLSGAVDVTLRGTPGKTWIVSTDEEGTVLTIQNSRGIVVDGIGFVHETGDETCAGNAIDIVDARDVVITRSDISGSGVTGVNAHSVDGLKITKNVLHRSTHRSVYVDTVRNVQVTGNLIRENRGAARFRNLWGDVRIENNTFTGNEGPVELVHNGQPGEPFPRARILLRNNILHTTDGATAIQQEGLLGKQVIDITNCINPTQNDTCAGAETQPWFTAGVQ